MKILFSLSVLFLSLNACALSNPTAPLQNATQPPVPSSRPAESATASASPAPIVKAASPVKQALGATAPVVAPQVTSTVNPYLTYNFLLSWNGKTVGAFSSASGLVRTTQEPDFHGGTSPQSAFKIPGQTDFQPIILSRGMSQDAEFQQWMNTIFTFPNTPSEGGTAAGPTDLSSYRRDLRLEFYNQAGLLVLAYILHDCWPSEYTALPDTDPTSDAVAINRLTLQIEGWERDTTVVDPTSPDFTAPAPSESGG